MRLVHFMPRPDYRKSIRAAPGIVEVSGKILASGRRAVALAAIVL